MKRSMTETLLGAVVVLIALVFLAYSYKTADISTGDGYVITADFSGVGGLKPGDNVQVSGVKVGNVLRVELLPDSYLARVYMNIRKGFQFPTDTAAAINSESLLGGLYMSLEPGAEEDMIPPEGKIQFTQAPQSLEQLLGKFIFSLQDEKKDQKEDEQAEPTP